MINKKFILSVLVLGFLTATVASGTWAYFSDSKDSTGNAITSGTLFLSPLGESSWSFPLSTTIAPGDTHFGSVVVTNGGNIAGTLTATLASTPGSTHTFDTVPGFTTITGSELDTQLSITVDDGTTLHTYTGTALTLGTMNFGTLSPGSTGAKTIKVTYLVPTTAGNEIQGETDSLKLTFHLDQ